MALIPIEHVHRLASPAQAEAFFRGLGASFVSARGFHTNDASRMARLIDAIEPERDHTISFEGGTLTAAARAAFDVLARAPYEYLDVRAHPEDIRIWPALPRIWVHTNRDHAKVKELLGMHADEITIDQNTIETTSIPIALRLFHAVSPNELTRGFIKRLKPEAKGPFLRFLELAGTRVDAVLEIDPASARSLTELYAGEKLDWQSSGVLVDFPEGRVHGFLTSSAMSDADRQAWQVRVTNALERAKLL